MERAAQHSESRGLNDEKAADYLEIFLFMGPYLQIEDYWEKNSKRMLLKTLCQQI